MLITALRCPVLKTNEMGEGSLEVPQFTLVSKQGWAWHLMQFFINDLVLICRHAKPMKLLHL